MPNKWHFNIYWWLSYLLNTIVKLEFGEVVLLRKIANIVALISLLLLSACGTSSKTNEQKAAVEVGRYFLENYNNGALEKDIYYIFNPDEKNSLLDSAIVNKCKENEFYWIAYYDEHTVLISKGAYFQECLGYLFTDGTKPVDVAEKSKEFGFDEDSMIITNTISDNLYSYRAGL